VGGIDERLVEPTVVVPVLGPGAGPDDDAWGAFASAWLPLQDRLFRIALLLTRDRADAEDAVSDAMAATFRPWRSGRVESLDAYARRAVVNRVVGRGRRRVVAERFSRRRSGDHRGERELADDVAERGLLLQALSALPPRQRAIVVLRYYALLSVADTAAALGCAEGTVKSQTHDALATLRSWLGPAEEARP
jgi:RNA polymerase sigma-70 factor (sigma-E family)